MMKKIRRCSLFSIGIFIFAFGGFLVVMLAPQQLAAGADSFAYVSAAQSYAAGEGFRSVTWDGQTEVMTHFPPLYSFFLSGFGLTEVPLQIAKWLNALVLAGNIFFVGIILLRLTEHEWIALAGSAIFLTSDMVLDAHFNIWTEPLFVFWLLAMVYSLDSYMQAVTEKQRLIFLILTAVLAGVGTLTRYVGVTLIGTTALVILLFSAKHWREVLLFTAVACLPLVIWFMRNAIQADSATNRVIAYHAIRGEQLLLDALYTFGLWLLPGIRVSLVTGIGYLLLLLVALVVKRPFRPPVSIMFVWCVFFVFVYFGFLLFSISFIDAHTPFNYRILFPVYAVSVIILLASLAQLLPKVQKIPFVRVLPLGAFLVYFILNVMAGGKILSSFYQYGQGYTAVAWQESELMNQVFLTTENATVYTNVPDAFYFVSNETVVGVPIEVFATSRMPNEAYSVELEAMFKEMQEKSAVLVYFDRISRGYLPTEEQLKQMAPLTAAFENQEGTIYVWETDSQ